MRAIVWWPEVGSSSAPVESCLSQFDRDWLRSWRDNLLLLVDVAEKQRRSICANGPHVDPAL
eukprot:2575323-Pyramimonas_sp.AAC.1